MLKSILKLNEVKLLSKDEQQFIGGGSLTNNQTCVFDTDCFSSSGFAITAYYCLDGYCRLG